MRTSQVGTWLLALVLVAAVLAAPTPVAAQESNRTATAIPTVTPTEPPTPPENDSAGTATPTPAPGVSAGTVTDARAARLVVRQPHYVDSDVERRTTNGTPVYVARGQELVLRPEGFDSEAVVDVEVSPTGELDYDRDMGVYRFRPSETGTYTISFVVRETELVGSADSRTVTVRYVARVRVSGGLDLIHRAQSELAGIQEAAANWREWNATAHGIAGEDVPTQALMEEAANLLKLRHQPVSFLTGNYTQVLMLMLIGGLGGWIVLAQFTGLPALAYFRERARNSRFNVAEAEEGTAKEAQAELDELDRRQQPQTTRLHDLFDDPRWVAALEQAYGPTLGDVAERFRADAVPSVMVARFLQILGANGWVGIEADHDALGIVPADGDDAEAAEIVLRRETEVPGEIAREHDDILADPKVHDLTGVTGTEDRIERFDWSAVYRAFDVEEIETLPEDIQEGEGFDVEAIAERFDIDVRQFDDVGDLGRCLERTVSFIHDSPTLCDAQGNVDESAYALGRLQKLAQFMDDRYDWPEFGLLREEIRLARQQHDPNAEVQRLVDRVQQGDGG